MTSPSRPKRTGTLWAVVGGIVLIGGIAAIAISASLGSPTTPPVTTPTNSSEPTNVTPPTSPTENPTGGEYVDPTASASGWVPEPITSDPEIYVGAALAAASTFDTTLSSRDEWLAYLDTWFTPDSRYGDADREARMQAAKLELRQGVVLPQDMWDSLAAADGRVVAEVVGDVELDDVPNDESGQMSIGTADVELTFTQADGTGSESSYTESARVSVQVLCGGDSTPTPDSTQQAGDCKVVRYFTEPLES